MRLSLRLMAERGGRADRLGFYLDDPLQLFVPARLLLGLIFSLADGAASRVADRARRAPHVDRDAARCASRSSSSSASTCCRSLIVRRNPERVLEVLLPPFDVVARVAPPADRRRWSRSSPRERPARAGRRRQRRGRRRRPATRRTA